MMKYFWLHLVIKTQVQGGNGEQVGWNCSILKE